MQTYKYHFPVNGSLISKEDAKDFTTALENRLNDSSGCLGAYAMFKTGYPLDHISFETDEMYAATGLDIYTKTPLFDGREDDLKTCVKENLNAVNDDFDITGVGVSLDGEVEYLGIESAGENKIGDNVYWMDAYGDMRNGNITEIFSHNVNGQNVMCAHIYEHSLKAEMGVELNNCYTTAEECMAAESDRAQAQRKYYMDSIKNVNDLVKFLWEHDINSEDADYDARYAVNEKAKELIGYDLENNMEYATEDDFSKAVSEIPTQDAGIMK